MRRSIANQQASAMLHIYQPPAPLPASLPAGRSLFLAGSIENGLAEPWQDQVIAALADCDGAILNPRREAWDATWVQSIENPQFREQVEWELAGLERAALIAMYFSPTTKSPITLLELGLYASCGRIEIACPRGYWRRGNIEVVAARYGIPLYESLPELIAAIRRRWT